MIVTPSPVFPKEFIVKIIIRFRSQENPAEPIVKLYQFPSSPKLARIFLKQTVKPRLDDIVILIRADQPPSEPCIFISPVVFRINMIDNLGSDSECAFLYFLFRGNPPPAAFLSLSSFHSGTIVFLFRQRRV